MDRLKFTKLLKDAGLNQSDLCQKVGVSNNTVSNWNKDESYPAWLEDYLCWQIAKDKIVDLKDFLNDIESI